MVSYIMPRLGGFLPLQMADKRGEMARITPSNCLEYEGFKEPQKSSHPTDLILKILAGSRLPTASFGRNITFPVAAVMKDIFLPNNVEDK